MRPFFFGREEKPLFGIHHPPTVGSVRARGVVLCPPFGPEYLRAHRSLRELAHGLAGSGLHVLRFDYHGTGDSGGAKEEGTVEQWLEDVGSALEEAKEAAGATRVSLVGLRLGAALAALASSGRRDIDSLVLWNPIVSGQAHLDDLLERHATLMATRPRPKGYRPDEPPTETLGAPLTAALREGLGAIDLTALPGPPAPRVAVVCNEDDPPATALYQHLRQQGAAVELEHQPDSRFWLRQDDIERALVPQASLRLITGWLSQ